MMLLSSQSVHTATQLAAFCSPATGPPWSHFLLPELMEHEGLHPPGLGIVPLAGSRAGREKSLKGALN